MYKELTQSLIVFIFVCRDFQILELLVCKKSTFLKKEASLKRLYTVGF